MTRRATLAPILICSTPFAAVADPLMVMRNGCENLDRWQQGGFPGPRQVLPLRGISWTRCRVSRSRPREEPSRYGDRSDEHVLGQSL